MNCLVHGPKIHSQQFRHYATARECFDYLTRRFDALRQQSGETPHGRVSKGAAAAKAPGKTTTEDLWTNGVSLATPASGPTPLESTIPPFTLGEATGVARDSEVPRAATAQPHEPQPSRQTGGRMTDGGSATSEVPRAATVQPQTTQTCARPGSPSRSHAVAHTQGVDEFPVAIQQVSNATADAANPYATCAGPTRPADRSQNPPDELPAPLKERAGEEVGSGETADEDCRARTKRIDGRPSQVETSEDETTTTTRPRRRRHHLVHPRARRSRGRVHHR